MASVYDRMYDDGARAEQEIEVFIRNGDYRRVKIAIDILLSASAEFEILADHWKDVATHYEVILVEEGIL